MYHRYWLLILLITAPFFQRCSPSILSLTFGKCDPIACIEFDKFINKKRASLPFTAGEVNYCYWWNICTSFETFYSPVFMVHWFFFNIQNWLMDILFSHFFYIFSVSEPNRNYIGIFISNLIIFVHFMDIFQVISIFSFLHLENAEL